MHDHFILQNCVVCNHLWPLDATFHFYHANFFGAPQLDLAPPRGNDDIIDQATCGQRRRPQPGARQRVRLAATALGSAGLSFGGLRSYLTLSNLHGGCWPVGSGLLELPSCKSNCSISNMR